MTDVNERELARDLRQTYDEVLVGCGSKMHVPGTQGTLCGREFPDEITPVDTIPPGYRRWCANCAARHIGKAPQCVDLDPERLAAVSVASDLEDAIKAHETVQWSDVPGVDTAEAAAWTQRLADARDRALDGAGGGSG